MATFVYGSGYSATTLNTANPSPITVSGSSFTITKPAWTVKGCGMYSGDNRSRYFRFASDRQTQVELWFNDYYTIVGRFPNQNTNTVANSNTYATLPASTTGAIQTSTIFNSSNKNKLTEYLYVYMSGIDAYITNGGWFTVYEAPSGSDKVMTCSVTLNAPPTFDLVDSSDNPTTQVWFDTPYVYTGLTTASIRVKSISAKYGGDISSIAFTIGNQTVSSTSASAQTLSIPLNVGGTFTPTVKVTDSRGQVTTKNLNAITVNTYVTPSVLFSVERTDSSGVSNDEGENAVATAKFDWTEAITTIAEPTIVAKDPNNLTVSVTKTWYKDRALTTPVTDWSEITEDMQVYCLLDNANHNAFNTQYSYQIAITPIDGLDSSGTTITQTLGGAFYTVDFLAGGHGIAFGQPSTEEGFFCNMDATFKEDLVAQDMTAQEVQDFVDNLEGGGGGGSGTVSAICSLASGWANYADAFYPTVYRSGNVCTFVWSAKPTAASIVIDGNYKQICTIPEGFRPPQELHGIFQGSATSIYLLTINQNGNVYISRMREISNNAGSYSTAGSNNGYLWFPMFMTYVVL